MPKNTSYDTNPEIPPFEDTEDFLEFIFEKIEDAVYWWTIYNKVFVYCENEHDLELLRSYLVDHVRDLSIGYDRDVHVKIVQEHGSYSIKEVIRRKTGSGSPNESERLE